MSDAKKLLDMMKKIQEPRGFFFNKDEGRTLELLGALLVNKERYGYMACPCRLASGEREDDLDIICPCEYRDPDVKEHGSCYCNLYVSRKWNKEEALHSDVPERRPVDKVPF